MKTTITQISNIFNLLSQIDIRIFNYHYGYRYDINKNIANNFDPTNDTGRMFPAVSFDVPDNIKYLGDIDYVDIQEEIQVTLYFDDLQGYYNDGSLNVLNPVEQWQRLKQIGEDFIANFRYLFEDKYGAGYVGKPTFVPRANLYNDKIITWEVSFQLTHDIPCTDVQYQIDPADFPDDLDEDDLERVGGVVPSACDRIIAQLNDTLLLTCILPLYDFAQVATQNALSVQQILDLKTWLLPQYDFSDSVWQNLLTAQQESDLIDYLLPSVDFTDVAIQAIITPQQQSDLVSWLLPLVDFSDPSIQAIITAPQQADLQAWLCSAPVLPRYSTTFDGGGESVLSLYNANHELERTDLFTIDVWVKITSYTLGAIIGKFDYVGTRRGWVVWTINSGQVVFELASNEGTGNTVTTITVAQIPLNVWTRVTITYGGTSTAAGVLMYLNKVSTPYTVYQSPVTGTTVDASNVIEVGGSAPAYFAGRIYEAMVYKNRVLTPAEITALPTVTDTPIYESDLIYWNSLGMASIWGTTVRNYPDRTGILSGFQSQNIEIGDLSTDIPV